MSMTGPIPSTPAAQLFTVESLERAWISVKRAGGGAGVDGVTLRTFQATLPARLQELRDELASGNYRPKPMRQVLVPKSKGGLRPIALWAIQDRIAQRAIYEIIAPAFESIFLPCSYGFRPGLNVHDAIEHLIRYRDRHLRWVLDADIKECFQEIDSRRLMKLVAPRVHDRLLRRYIRGWLDARILNSADGGPRKAGASQGSVLSPLLANIYLHEMDQIMQRQKYAYIRYADDIVICCRRKSQAETARIDVASALGHLGLRLNDHKTRVVHFDQGVTWLGYFLVRNQCYRV